MPTTNDIHGFIRTNMSSCRKFWGCLYTCFFVSAWVSLYLKRGETKLIATSIHVVMGLVFYFLMLLVIPLFYLIDQALKIKERVENVKSIHVSIIVRSIVKTLAFVMFPSFAFTMGRAVEDNITVCMWVGFGGSLHSLLIFYVNPTDNGISDAFIGMWVGVILNLEKLMYRFTWLAIIALLRTISLEMMDRETKAKVQ